MSQIHSVNISGREFYLNKDQGIAPIFTLEIRARVRAKKTCNIAVVGEAGTGKSYTAMQIGRALDPKFASLNNRYNNIDPKFSLPQVVFGYKGYLTVLMKLGIGKPIVFDEPSYAMGKREWYKQVNQALVKTVESARFLVKPLIIPIINMSLLDKTIRSFLIQYMVVLQDRGKGNIYRISASQFQDKVYRKLVCRFRYGLIENDLCDKDSCLGCKELDECQFLRARYEKKKRSIQYVRYEQDLEEAGRMEHKQMTLSQLAKIIHSVRDRFYDDNKINVTKMKLILMSEFGIPIGMNKSYDLRTQLQLSYPEDYPS